MVSLAHLFQKKVLLVLGVGLAIVLAAVASVQPYLPQGILRKAFADLFVWLVLTAPILAAGWWARGWFGELGFRRRDVPPLALFMLAMYVGGFLFIKFFFATEETIKVYDSTVYWIKVIEDQRLISESIPGYLVHLRETFAQEYANLGVLPLIPVSRYLGIDFAGYCASVLFTYYLPACLFLTLFILRLSALAKGCKPGVTAFIACFCLCALCVPFLWPVMNGYLDVGGALFFVLLLNASLHWDPTEFSLKKALVLAALTLLAVLYRRWYAFNIVAFYFSFGVTAFFAMLAGGGSGRLKKLGVLILNMVVIAGFCALCFLAIHPRLFSLFLSSYSTAYSSMKSMGMLRNFWEIAENMGVLWLAAAYLGMYFLLKSGKTRLICLRILLIVGLSFYLFCRIQYMGYHQDYLVIPGLLALAGVTCAHAVDFTLRKRLFPLTLLFFAVTAANFFYGYEPRLQSVAAMTEPLTSVMRRYPQKDENHVVIRKVMDDLTEKIGDASRFVYVVGDGADFSPELLKRSHLPEKVDAAPFVLVNSIMDLRDGFPSQMFMADYVLIHDPLLTGFPNPQQVSLQVNDMLLHDPQMAAYYHQEDIYSVSTGNIILFKKIRPADVHCVDNLKERLRGFFPDAPFMYEPNYFVALCGADGDTRYSFNFWEQQSFTVHKTPGLPASLRLNDVRGLSTLSFAVSSSQAGLTVRVLNQDGEIFRQPIPQAWTNITCRVDVGGSDFLVVGVAESEPDEPVGGDFFLHHPILE